MDNGENQKVIYLLTLFTTVIFHSYVRLPNGITRLFLLMISLNELRRPRVLDTSNIQHELLWSQQNPPKPPAWKHDNGSFPHGWNLFKARICGISFSDVWCPSTIPWDSRIAQLSIHFATDVGLPDRTQFHQWPDSCRGSIWMDSDTWHMDQWIDMDSKMV